MSLLPTSRVRVGALLAFVHDPTTGGGSFVWGDPTYLSISKGDVVMVQSIETKSDTPWAKVLVSVVKGSKAGRVGYVSIDLSSRRQRCWQQLTASGSIEPVRRSGSYRKHSSGNGVAVDVVEVPATRMAANEEITVVRKRLTLREGPAAKRAAGEK